MRTNHRRHPAGLLAAAAALAACDGGRDPAGSGAAVAGPVRAETLRRPLMSDCGLALGDVTVAGANGTGGAFKIDDTVTVTVDTGGANGTVDAVTLDLSDFGGSPAAAAVDDGSGACGDVANDDVWTACVAVGAGLNDAAGAVGVDIDYDPNGGCQENKGTFVIDTVAPTVTTGNISVTGASGTGGAFIVGDTVTATWDNTAGGQNNTDTISSVAVNFFGIAGATAVAAANSNNTWTATHVLAAGALDTAAGVVTVTPKDDAGNTASADSAAKTVDTVKPTVSAGEISVCGDTDGVFVTDDTIRVVWDNRAAGGDGNTDLRAVNPVAVNFFGIAGATAVNAAASVDPACAGLAVNAQVWVATHTVAVDDLDALDVRVKVTATDDAANATQTTDNADYDVDATFPAVTTGNIHVCGDTAGLFVEGDTVTVAWDNRGSGDDNDDLKAGSPVTVDFFGIAGATEVAAAASAGAACGLPSHAQVWVASYVLDDDDLDANDVFVAVSVTDDADQKTTTTDAAAYDVDTTPPTVTAARIETCGDTAGLAKTGDTVKVHWDNRAAGGDANTDLKAAAPVKVNFFGIAGATAVVATNNTAGCGVAANAHIWVASYVLADDDLDATGQAATVSVTDDGGHTTARADDEQLNVDTTEPVVTAAHIHVCGDVSGRFTHLAGEKLVTVAWDNRGAGNANTDLRAADPVSVNFFGIQGRTAVVAANNTASNCDGLPSHADVWVATYTLLNGDKDATGQAVAVTAVDHAAYSTTTTDDELFNVDTVPPTVTAAHIHVCGDDGGIFQAGDTVTVVWDNRSTGDNNTDLKATNPVTINYFDIGGANNYAVNAVKNTAGCGFAANANVWVGSRVLLDDEIDATAKPVRIKVTDDGTHTSQRTDDGTYNVDTTEPVVGAARIHICGATGTSTTFKVGDTVTVAWDNRSTGDNNTDLKASNPVTVDFFGLPGATAAVAAANVAPICPGLAQNAQVWVARYVLPEGAMDATSQVVSVSVTDDSGYLTETDDDAGQKVDIVKPVVQVADLRMDTSDASGIGGYFIVGDRVRLEWLGDDNPSGEIVAVTTDFRAWSGAARDAAAAAVAMRDNGQTVAGCADSANANRTWTACYDMVEGDAEATAVTASILATDNAGNTNTGTDGDTYNVDGVSPTVALAGHGVFTYAEGTAITFSPTYTQGHSYSWTFGDGGVAAGTGAANRNPQHSYDDQGVYDVDVTVTDNHGNTASDSRDFTMTNANPAPNPQSVTALGADGVAGGADDSLVSLGRAVPEDEAIVLFTVRNTTDPSPVDVLTLDYLWDLGDGSTIAFGAGGAADMEYDAVDAADSCSGYAACADTLGCTDYASCKLAVEHDYEPAGRGTYTVALTATDKDGGAAVAEFTLIVSDVIPTLTAAAVVASMDEADRARPVSVRATLTNPVLNVLYTFAFDWKDGGADQVGPVRWDGVNALTVTQAHIYDDDPPRDEAAYAVGVSVTTHTGVPNAAPDVSLTVNNLPPVAGGALAPGQTPAEGSALRFAAASTDPSPFDKLSHQWDFDTPGNCANLAAAQRCPDFAADAAGDTAVHTYDDDGAYQVCVRATDDDGGIDDLCFRVAVANVAPVALPPADVQDAIEGIPFSVEGGGQDVGGDAIAGYVFTLAGCEAVGQAAARATFVCRDDGVYVGTLAVTDGADLGDPVEFNVFVANRPPSAKTCVALDAAAAPNAGQLVYDAFPPAGCQQAADITVDEAARVAFAAAGADRGDVADPATSTLDDVAPNALLYSWNLGDGGLPRTGQVVTHAFDRVQDTYVVELTIQDKDGGRAVFPITVHVRNVAPAADSIAVITDVAGRVEGSPIWFRGQGSDAGAGALSYLWTTWRFRGQGCGAVQGQPLGQRNGTNLRDVSFTFPDNDEYMACLTVRDAAQADSPPAELRVAVANVAPTADAGPERVVDEGVGIRLTGSASDPGQAENLEYSWDFGDCTAEAAFDPDPRSADKTWVDDGQAAGCDAPHDGAFVARLTVRDKDGGVGTATTRVIVRNVAPVLPLLPPVPVVEGIETTFFPGAFALLAVDPGAADVLSYSFSWGDGADTGPLVRGPEEGGPRSLVAVTAPHTYAQDGRYVGRVCVRDDGAPPGESCRTFAVLADNYRPRVVPVDDVGVRGDSGVRQDATFDQGIVNCLPVLVQDIGLLDHALTDVTLVKSPPGMVVRGADVGQDPVPAPDLLPHEHIAGWICWDPPESAIDTATLVRVQVSDDREATTQDWRIRVVKTDDDEDGMPDSFELSHPCFEEGLLRGEGGCTPCLDPAAPDAGRDYDEDGVLNIEEYERGSDPCSSDAPTAPAVVAPSDGGEVRERPAILRVSNAFDPNIGAVFREHGDLQPLRYLFALREGLAPPDDPDFSVLGRDGCEEQGVAPGAQVTAWAVDLPGAAELVENTDYAWRAWACDGFAIGPGAGGTFFFNEIDEAPTAPVMREPWHGDEDLPSEVEFLWGCSSDIDRDAVGYEVEIRLLGESRPFLAELAPPCEPGEALGRYTVRKGLAPDRWYEWSVRARDEHGLVTGPVGRPPEAGEEAAPAPPWAFLVNADNVCPAAPTLLSPVTRPVPPAADRIPEVTVTEVRTRTPELRFRAPLTPDPDGNPVHYRIDVDAVETFDSPAKASSPPLLVAPGAEGVWTVADGVLADDAFVWWRAVAVDGTCDGEPAATLIYVNTQDGPPSPGGAGQPRDIDTRNPILVADDPKPADPDGDLFTCDFEVVRMDAGATECPPAGSVCAAPGCTAVAEASGIPPEEGGAVAWRVGAPLRNRHLHCWRHRCCDAGGCSERTGWTELQVQGHNQCPRGIRLIGPDSDDGVDLDAADPLSLEVANADDPDLDTHLRYSFEVYTDPHLRPEDRVVSMTVEEGQEGRTRLTFEQGREAMAALREGMGARSVQVFHWRARATDGSDACESEWTRLARFVVERQIPGEGCACEAVGPSRRGAGGSGPWLLGLAAWAALWRRRRGAAVRPRPIAGA